MLRTTLFASLLFTTTAACVDEETTTGDSAVQGDGKADAWGVPAEHKVLDEVYQPDHVLQDSTHVYYTLFTEADEVANPQTRSVMRVRRSDGSVEKIATIVGYPSYAALGGSFIYFADYEHVYKLPKSGGEPVTVSTIQQTTALAADATNVYIAAATYENDRYFHRISKVASAGSAPVELARATYVTSLAVDNTHVYWLDETAPNPAIGCGRNTGQARKVSKLGGLDVTLQIGINCPLVAAVDGTNLYYSNWSTSGSGNPVVKLPKNGGIPTVLGRTSGMQLAVDPSYVYWISNAGDLVRSPKSFALPRTVAADVNFTLAGADAAGTYFWRVQDDPRVYSLYRVGQ